MVDSKEKDKFNLGVQGSKHEHDTIEWGHKQLYIIILTPRGLISILYPQDVCTSPGFFYQTCKAVIPIAIGILLYITILAVHLCHYLW